MGFFCVTSNSAWGNAFIPRIRCEWKGLTYEQLHEDIRVTTYLESP